MGFKYKDEIICLIECFLAGKKTIQELQDCAWNVIDELSKENTTDASKDIDSKVFWFAIWQIQHLASEEHLQDGTLQRELKKTLKYLLNPTSMPANTYGLPPQ